MTTPPSRRRAKRGSGEQLRGAILEAAKKLLGEAGSSEEVSIRAIADLVGVTPPSIYLHFADKDTLIEAVVVDLFGDLGDRMAAAATHPHPLERLCQQGMAYIQFALDAPEHYRIATMLPQASAGPVDMVLQTSAFANFARTIVECMDLGLFARGDPTPIALELWAAAHGITSLLIFKPYLPWGDPMRVAYRVMRAASTGQLIVEYLGDDIGPEEYSAWLAHLPQPPERSTGP